MIRIFKKVILIFVTVFLIASCASRKGVIYMQNATETEHADSYEPVIQEDDVLLIIVSSENPEVSALYNLASVNMQGTSESAVYERRLQTYIVDKNGNIEFPMIGSVKLGGLTKTEAVNYIKELLKEHIKDAVVNLRILNFEITVLGEVTRPGAYTINSERVTLLEAIGKAGDMTIYGNRKKVMIVREENGKTTSHIVDLTKSDFINSPFYYLNQNDVVYVEPNKTRVNSSVVGPNITVGISALSLVVTIIALTIR